MKKDEIISLEYQKAQDSAEHYNTMIWTLISIGIAFSLTILYTVWSQENNIILEILMLFIGIFVLFYFSHLIESANEKKAWKYYVCRRIEKENGFIGHNLKVDYLPISKSKLWWRWKFGIGVFRIMKLLLYLLYFLALVVTIVNLWKMKAITLLITISIIFTLLAFIGSIIIESIYLATKHDFDKLWNVNPKELPL